MADPVHERNAGGGAGPAAYDYLLVVGPGRSGSTYLYRLLNAHPAFATPQIKEGHCYRSTRRFDRALRGPRKSGAILLDVANTAWADPRLASVSDLCRRGHRVLLVVLLRRHRERAVSVMAYKRSRVLPAVFAGPGGIERDALEQSLSAQALARIFTLGAGRAHGRLRHPGRQSGRRARGAVAAVCDATIRAARHESGQRLGERAPPPARRHGHARGQGASYRRRPPAAAGAEGRRKNSCACSSGPHAPRSASA